ncbi:MAG: RHS repeat protein, partial [Acidobacteria bacterium]|nr:RHS repeat protein [Acidobacteriota bacterium]
MQEHHHITSILRFPTSTPDGTTAFRGVRLTHPSFDDMAGDYAGIKGYLFATSAILKEEAIYGVGLPADRTQPSNPTVYRTTVYDGFDLHSWANPSGSLGTSLPVTAIARRTRIFTPGLPTRTILAGDPGNPAACDARGPIQTDEWTGPEQPTPSASDTMSATIASSQVSLGNSAIPGSVHRNGTIQRHFDWGLLRLLTTQDQKTLDGDGLPESRGTSAVNFGTTTFHYDSLGRITDETGDRGGYSANEHRDYNGPLPQISATTKTLTGPDGAIYPNPALPAVQAGVSRTFGGTYYQWTATETDKTDGRTSTINTRDGLGRVTKQTDVLGTVTNTTYNPWGQVELVTREAKGSVGAVSTTTTYDPNGRWMETTATADGKTFRTHTDYDAFGHAIAVSTYDANDALATTQTFQYDGFGQKTGQSPVLVANHGVTQTSWGTERWAYDPQGRVTDHWDAQGRLLMHVITQPTWTTLHGVAGVWTTTQDDRGFTRSEAVDLLGQKRAVVDQKGQLSTYTYDQDGHLTGTNQDGQQRSYIYNAMGWLTSRTEPEEGKTEFSSFTMAGTPLVTTQVRPTGTRTFATTLDAHLLPTQITATGPEGSVTRTLSYDPATRFLIHLNETQAITGLPVQALSEAYGYDPLGRLIAKTVSDGDDGFLPGHSATVTQSFTVSQTLNDGGQVTSLTYPSGGGKASQTSTLAYDALNRPLTVKLDGALRGMMTYGTPNQTSVTNTLILGNGAQSVSVMDKGELVRSEHLATAGVLEDDTLTWTAGGLMLSRGPVGNPDTFDYDELQRLSHSVVHGVYGETVEQW